MTVGVQAFRGKRLKEARLARGLFKTTLADMVGVSGWAITRYEDGIDRPQMDKLEALAQSLKFPIAFFSQPEWAETPELIFWRSRSAETKIAREMTEQRMIWLCEVFSFLEREVDFPHLNLPGLGLPSDFRLITPERIEQAAEQLRNCWKLSDRPIPDVTLALENAGIPVAHLEIASDKQDGFCFWSNQNARFFVGINTANVSAARARYDASHELGHALLHRHVTVQQARDPAAHKVIEQQAHRFAAAFLFPRDQFFREVGSPSLDYFCSLKRRWGMSIGAMVYRAFDLELIDKVDRDTLFRNMTRRRWRGPLREPFDNRLEMPLERPRMLRRAMDVLVSDSAFGAESIRSAIALPDKEVEQIASVNADFFGRSNLVHLATPKAPGIKVTDHESGKVVEFRKSRPD